MKYKINTYGCQMNVHESEKIAGILRGLGYDAESDDDYDIVVFNTCCIRDNAEKKISGHIGAIKAVKARRKNLIVAVMGCMSQQDGAAESLLKRFPFIDIIIGANNLDSLAKEIVKVRDRQSKHIIDVNSDDRPEIFEFDGAYRTSGVNAWVNIMYGCNNYCTYCVVPYVRGRERSREPQRVIEEVTKLVAAGYKEITLLGQNVNSYGSDFGNNYSFAQLLQQVDKIEGSHRIRFMTSHPKDMTREAVEIIAQSEHISRYIHLPLQAGSNAVLEAMNRRYTREKYLETVDMIRAVIPECGITTDLMVGFPTETEEDFEQTLDMVERVKFSGAFTYIYSPRKGTRAAAMEQIPYAVKSKRIQRLIAKQNEITNAISRGFEGKTVNVLVESESNGELSGRTDCNRRVKFLGDAAQIGNYADVEILRNASSSLVGRALSYSSEYKKN